MNESTIETPLFTTEITIQKVSTRIQELAQQLCQAITHQGKGKQHIKKLGRQQRQYKKIASNILKQLQQLYQLRRQARSIRRYYRRTPAPTIFAETGQSIKQESLEN